GTPRQISATTVESCELDHVRRDEFVDFLNHHSEQFRAALDELSMQHSCILSAIRRFALSPSLLANLARFLLGLNCPDNTPQTDTINLKLSQEEIGQHLGATRESVARALSTLRKNNIVKQSGRTLTILNRGVLEHLAGGRTEEAAQ